MSSFGNVEGENVVLSASERSTVNVVVALVREVKGIRHIDRK